MTDVKEKPALMAVIKLYATNESSGLFADFVFTNCIFASFLLIFYFFFLQTLFVAHIHSVATTDMMLFHVSRQLD